MENTIKRSSVIKKQILYSNFLYWQIGFIISYILYSESYSLLILFNFFFYFSWFCGLFIRMQLWFINSKYILK